MNQRQVFPAAPDVKRDISRTAYQFFVGGTGVLIIDVIVLAGFGGVA